MRSRLIAVSLCLVSIGVVSVARAPVGRAETVQLPASMAALGDSITRAHDACCWYGDHPSNSWSSGLNSWDGVRSHYERILSVKWSIYGRAYNDAVSGAKMASLQTQAAAAVSQNAQYVTILMGANDVCTSSRWTMTSTGDFRAQFEAAMTKLVAGLPKAHIFVSSIPNIYRLWSIFHTNSTAQFIWSTAHICQSMLATSNTESDRQAVLARELEFNRILGEVCARYTNCRFDGNAVFNYQFSTSQVSKLDYFHPNLSGQSALASITWARSWWSTT